MDFFVTVGMTNNHQAFRRLSASRHDDQVAHRFFARIVCANFSDAAQLDRSHHWTVACHCSCCFWRVGLPSFECVLPTSSSLFGITKSPLLAPPHMRHLSLRYSAGG